MLAMRAYELMIIFTADTEESAVQTTANNLAKMAEEAGGTLEKIDKWGVRRFAYEMKRPLPGGRTHLILTGIEQTASVAIHISHPTIQTAQHTVHANMIFRMFHALALIQP